MFMYIYIFTWVNTVQWIHEMLAIKNNKYRSFDLNRCLWSVISYRWKAYTVTKITQPKQWFIQNNTTVNTDIFGVENLKFSLQHIDSDQSRCTRRIKCILLSTNITTVWLQHTHKNVHLLSGANHVQTYLCV